MNTASSTFDAPPPELLFKRKVSLRDSLRELWGSRELLRTLAERDLRARYKQQLLGFAWAIVMPFVMMIVFTLFVKRVANVDTGDIPYPLFTYVALIPWSFFASAVTSGGTSVLSNSSLLTKVYCPREVFPLTNMVTSGVDMVISTSMLGILFLVFGFAPKATSVWIPVLLVIQLLFMVGVVLILSSLLVYLRDLRQILPLFLQLALFATPIAYPIDIEGSLKWVYAAVNPLAPVIDGYRRAILIGEAPHLDLLGVAAVTATLTAVLGYWLFKRLERGFADVV